FAAKNRIDGHVTASQMAAASYLVSAEWAPSTSSNLTMRPGLHAVELPQFSESRHCLKALASTLRTNNGTSRSQSQQRVAFCYTSRLASLALWRFMHLGGRQLLQRAAAAALPYRRSIASRQTYP